jgi:hypothetical protein
MKTGIIQADPFRAFVEAIVAGDEVTAIRVCPETSGRIAKFSEHEAN